MKMYLRQCAFLSTIFLISLDSWAGNIDATWFTSQTNKNTNSQGEQLKYSSQLFNLGYPYQNEPESGISFGFKGHHEKFVGVVEEFNFYRLSLNSQMKFSKEMLLDIDFGGYQFQTPDRKIHSINGSVSLKNIILNDSLLSGLTLEKKHIAESGLFEDSGAEDVTALGLRHDSLLTMGQKHRVTNYLYQRWLNDKNKRFETDVQYMYGFSTNEVWFWMGLGGGVQFNDKPSSSYWSPTQQLSFGPRIDLSLPITEKLSFITGGSLNRFKENQTWGNGYYASASLKYGGRDSNNVSVEVIRNESLQNGSTWSYDRLAINGFYYF